MIAVMSKNASVKPTTGETIMGITTLSRMPETLTRPGAASRTSAHDQHIDVGLGRRSQVTGHEQQPNRPAIAR